MANREIKFPFNTKGTLIFLVFSALLVYLFTQSYFDIEKKEQERNAKGFEEFAKTLIETNKKENKNKDSNKALDLKKRESFTKGEELFCQNNQIISKRSGWVLNGDLFIKDDRYYSLADCFLKSN